MDPLDNLFDELLAEDPEEKPPVKLGRELEPWQKEKEQTPKVRATSKTETSSTRGSESTYTVDVPSIQPSAAMTYTHSVLKESVDKKFFRPNDQAATTGSRQPACPPPVVEDHLSREAADLLARVVGTQRLGNAWAQGFFCAGYQPYGLQQVEGGPCGVIAAVQAFVLKHLMTNLKEQGFSSVLKCSTQDRTEAIIDALTEIFWQAGDKNARILIPRAFGQVPLDAKRFIELRPVVFISKDQLREGLSGAYKEHFLSPSGGGVALFLYSIVYCRGCDNISKRDFDEENSGMIGVHGYCTQELVNLCIFGRAYTNVFDGCKRLGSDKDGYVVMQGVPRKCSVGFLSLFEAFQVHEVGSRLKCPQDPIWIIVAESHYTVLFADPNTFPDTKACGPCALFYFDPLSRQTDLLHLSIEPDGIASHLTGFEEDGSMIERVIRTKWKRAFVDWHGKEPIL